MKPNIEQPLHDRIADKAKVHSLMTGEKVTFACVGYYDYLQLKRECYWIFKSSLTPEEETGFPSFDEFSLDDYVNSGLMFKLDPRLEIGEVRFE